MKVSPTWGTKRGRSEGDEVKADGTATKERERCLREVGCRERKIHPTSCVRASLEKKLSSTCSQRKLASPGEECLRHNNFCRFYFGSDTDFILRDGSDTTFQLPPLSTL